MNNDLDSPKLLPHDAMRPQLTLTEGSAVEKNEFLGSMGHELRNPLSNIIAQVETLLEGVYGPLQTTQKSAVTAIQDSARQLLQLVADVVDLGRIEAGAALLTQSACMVSEQCASSVATVAALAKSRSIQICTEVQPHNLGVLADARRLQQIITELLSAAILSMHTGGRLQLRIVHDEGSPQLHTQGSASQALYAPAASRGGEGGMPAHLLSQLGKVKPIGLALLQQLVRIHGGSFMVREAAGQEIGMFIGLPLSRLAAVECPRMAA